MSEDDIAGATDLFQRHRDELGFVNRAQVREKGLFTERSGENVVGAVLYNHCVRKPQTTIYDIAVDSDHRRQGIATSLIGRAERDSPHDKLVAKCPQDLEANEFYRNNDWTRTDVEEGKSRTLNVWVKK